MRFAVPIPSEVRNVVSVSKHLEAYILTSRLIADHFVETFRARAPCITGWISLINNLLILFTFIHFYRLYTCFSCFQDCKL